MQRVRIAALAKKWQVEAILAEANAMGEPNVESLWRDHRLPVYGFKTTALSKPPLVENLVAALENGDLLILPDPVLLGELEAYTYRTSLGGQTVYHAPEGLHDDTVIALALAWKQASGRRSATTVHKTSLSRRLIALRATYSCRPSVSASRPGAWHVGYPAFAHS